MRDNMIVFVSAVISFAELRNKQITEHELVDMAAEHDISKAEMIKAMKEISAGGISVVDFRDPVEADLMEEELLEAEEDMESTDDADPDEGANKEDDYRQNDSMSAVGLFLRDVGRVDLLSKDEETELAERASSGDEDAKKAFAAANLRLVVFVAKGYKDKCRIPFEDLIQEGNVGLMKAVERFDPTKGYKFSTYATWWIRQTISRAKADKERMIRIPMHLIGSINKLEIVVKALEQEMSGEITNALIGREMGITEKKVEELKRIRNDAISYNIHVGEEEDTELLDIIDIKSEESTDNMIDNRDLRKRLFKAMKSLSEIEREILIMRYGLGESVDSDYFEPMTLAEIGEMLGVTRERVRQIEGKALRGMRSPSNRKMYESFL